MVIEKLIADFKKSNTARKEKLAKKYGFNTSEEYLNYLEQWLKRDNSPINQEIINIKEQIINFNEPVKPRNNGRDI